MSEQGTPHSSGVPRPEYPRPQFVRPDWVNLNGRWQFEMDLGRSGRERGLQASDGLAGEIVVPFCPESELSGIGCRDFITAAWYRRTFTIPEAWAGKRVLLHFGAADYETWVFVNGRQAGFHRGGYTPLCFDITALLQRGEDTLTVYVEDDTRSPFQPTGKQSTRFDSYACYYTRTTGIWQTVWLEAVPQAYIESVRLTPLLEQRAVLVQAKVRGSSGGTCLTATAVAESQQVGQAQSPVSGDHASCLVSLSQARAWGPGDPFLYDLKLSLERGDETVDRVQSYFGLRSLGLTGVAPMLNGKVLYQRLVLDQGFYPDGIYTAPTDEALKHDIVMSMALGFNGARLHEKVFDPRTLYWADKLGYLVWGEFPNWGLDQSHPLALQRFLTEWLTEVERDYSHPSIVGWCPFNETPEDQDPELLRMVYRATKSADPMRTVIDTSGYTHVETDMWDVHDYNHGRTLQQFEERYDGFARGEEPFVNHPKTEGKWGGQPYWVSEYGGIWWNPGQADSKAWGYGDRPRTVDEFVSRYRTLTEALLRNPRMGAFCYTQLTDVEQEVNGLYYYDRRPKFDADTMAQIRAINSQPAAVER
jgi:beta-galactosidase/beta-glucuronidase